MHPTKAHGPDGMHVKFYQQHWPIVGSKITQMVLDCLNNRALIVELIYFSYS